MMRREKLLKGEDDVEKEEEDKERTGRYDVDD